MCLRCPVTLKIISVSQSTNDFYSIYDTLFMQKAITAHEHINIYNLQTCRIASYTDIMLLSYSYFLTYYAHSINGRGALYINLKNIYTYK